MLALPAAATMTYSAPVLNAIALLASRAPACLEVSRKVLGHVHQEHAASKAASWNRATLRCRGVFRVGFQRPERGNGATGFQKKISLVYVLRSWTTSAIVHAQVRLCPKRGRAASNVTQHVPDITSMQR